MNSPDLPGKRRVVTSLLCTGSVVLGTSAGAATLTTRSVSCSPTEQTFVRHIELRHHVDAELHCDVRYAKPDEGGVASVLWFSARNSAFCEERFEHFVDKHRNVFGWRCSESTPVSVDALASTVRTPAPEVPPERVFEPPTDTEKAGAVAIASDPSSVESAEDSPLATAVPTTLPSIRTDSPAEPAVAEEVFAETMLLDEGSVSERVMEIALALENQRIGYNTEKLSDCSGIFHRVLDALQGHFPTLELPRPNTHRSTRKLARWYHERGLLRLVSSAADEYEAIRPGAVLFFGKNGKRYGDVTEEYLFDRATGIAHMGVVVDVTHDAEGRVSGYGLFHGRRTGTEAKITRYHRRSPSRPSHPPYGNGAQQWVAYSPVLPLASPWSGPDELIAENTE